MFFVEMADFILIYIVRQLENEVCDELLRGEREVIERKVEKMNIPYFFF